jgi:hypothetical protein
MQELGIVGDQRAARVGRYLRERRLGDGAEGG